MAALACALLCLVAVAAAAEVVAAFEDALRGRAKA
jgi:hypothetical protein